MPEKKPADKGVIYRVVQLFMEGKLKIDGVVAQVRTEFPHYKLSRQSVYPLLREAQKLGILRMVGPREQVLEARIRKRFNIDHDEQDHEFSNVTVVDCPRPESSDAVSAAAADVAYHLIKKLSAKRRGKPVGLGLGPGRATLRFSKSISELMKEDAMAPTLNLFGISSSCLPDAPQFAPVSFFNLFPVENVNNTLALFSQPLVRAGDLEKFKKETGVQEVFEEKHGIDVVVTSMGNMEDEHTLYRVFMERCYRDKEAPAWLKHCVADLQYRPFSKEGPIFEADDDYRLVTLFELNELVEMARTKDKYVILIARQCGLCQTQTTRAKGLLPIMKNPKLKLYTHVVMDSPTAKELLNEAGPPDEPRGATPATSTSQKAP